MNELLFVCLATIMVNNSGDTWNDHDKSVIKQAEQRCPQIFGEMAPCVMKFVKKEDQTYNVTCGPKQEKK